MAPVQFRCRSRSSARCKAVSGSLAIASDELLADWAGLGAFVAGSAAGAETVQARTTQNDQMGRHQSAGRIEDDPPNSGAAWGGSCDGAGGDAERRAR